MTDSYSINRCTWKLSNRNFIIVLGRNLVEEAGRASQEIFLQLFHEEEQVKQFFADMLRRMCFVKLRSL
jgi:hypothetical protein